jgi:3-methyl-2-oxobutanoate hydroxymethyltransferase
MAAAGADDALIGGLEPCDDGRVRGPVRGLETEEPIVTEPSLYGGPASRRVRVHHLRAAKERGERWAMLTAYDQYTAAIFDEVGIPVLLIGDSAANNVLGYETTIPVTVDELLPLVRAVARRTARALVVADLPFGSYQESPEQALRTATRFLKEGGAHAVKLEGGLPVVEHVRRLVDAGVAVVGHVGFTPQSEHKIGGYRVQGRGDDGDRLVADALALEAAGAFAVVLEMVPATVAKRVTAELAVPTIGIGAGPECDAQVLVWQDMAGLRPDPMPRFVKKYADLRGSLLAAAAAFAEDVRDGRFPGPGQSYE